MDEVAYGLGFDQGRADRGDHLAYGNPADLEKMERVVLTE
jgi:hypothetical protein